jgi:LPXTG-motif cell wall-anchored protein
LSNGKRVVLTVVGVIAALLVGSPAGATGHPGPSKSAPTPTFETCPNLAGWYVNPDETDRKPKAKVEGLEFSGKQLIHHQVSNMAVGELDSSQLGYTVAKGSQQPDQDSFFSVEVRNADGSGYATLRWNTTSHKWNMTTGGQFYEDLSPTELVKKTTPAKGNMVFSFGVGYTANPPGTKATTIGSVKFKGKSYDLTCYPPKASASPSPSKSATGKPSTSSSASASTSASASASHTAGAVPSATTSAPAGSLPVTGPKVTVAAILGLIMLAFGAFLVYRSRKNKVRFTA